MHRRREALLRLARRFAAETDADRLLDDLLREAIELLGGSAGVVTRWDDESELLVAVHGSTPALAQLRLRLGEGACGRAAQQRVPVLVERGRGHGKPPGEPVDAVLESAQLESAIAVPLVHDARLVGTLSVGRNGAASESAFTQEDAQLLEMLASTAAAALVGLEHARLDGVLLAARTAQHELNNQLAVARGYAEILADREEANAFLEAAPARDRRRGDERGRRRRRDRPSATQHRPDPRAALERPERLHHQSLQKPALALACLDCLAGVFLCVAKDPLLLPLGRTVVALARYLLLRCKRKEIEERSNESDQRQSRPRPRRHGRHFG